MYRSDSPYLVDWYVVSLRWIILLGTIVSVSLAGDIRSPGNLLLAILILWNMIITWMSSQNRRFKYHREINVIVDMFFPALFFWAGGGLLGPAAWLIILPLFSAGLYFNLIGGVLAAGVLIVVEAGDYFIHGTNIIVISIGAVGTMVLGLLFGFVSQQAYNHLQVERRKQIANRERQQKGETDRLRAIYNMSSALTSTLSYKRVLDSALDLSINALHVEEADPNQDKVATDSGLTSAVLLFENHELVVGSARRFTQVDMRIKLPAKQGILARTIEEGEPLVTKNVANDPELGRIIGFSGCNSVYCLPMRSGFDIYGVMVFGHPTSNISTANVVMFWPS